MKCKICDGEMAHYALLDENHSCNNSMPDSGATVEYGKCVSCGFIQTNAFDLWTKQDFLNDIYNDEYVIVDPDYTGQRPAAFANWFGNTFRKLSANILDYGAGSALFEKEIRAKGFTNVSSYDPMWPNCDINSDWAHSFDIVTAFEVFEHTPDPITTMLEVASFVKPNGTLVVSTLMNDDGQNNWYVAPRNGHVCMHSNESLRLLFNKANMGLRHQCISIHFGEFNK